MPNRVLRVNMKTRTPCPWPGDDPLMIAYHDTEWGVPVLDDRLLYEFLVLESAQAGLSWRTILHKRKGYKRLFANFDYKKVARFTPKDVNRLLKDASIIRNRAKIEATITNAQRFLEIQKEFGSFSSYMWAFVKNKPVDSKRKSMKDIPAVTPVAEAFAKDLKKRGFKFMGPTIAYAHMQAVGMVNDHLVSCVRHNEVKGRPKKT